jgi:predicted DNA-binding transcriptional regulator AlpA
MLQKRKKPDAQAPLPFSSATLWRKVKTKTFPQAVKLSENLTAWKRSGTPPQFTSSPQV